MGLRRGRPLILELSRLLRMGSGRLRAHRVILVFDVDGETWRVSRASEGHGEGPEIPDVRAPPASVADAFLGFRGGILQVCSF